MTQFRFIPLAIALTTASTLIACATTPAMTMGSAPASGSMAAPEGMAGMDAQMKNMREMHDKMMSAKTPEEHNRLMAEHMKSMQDGMKMMDGMSGPGMGDMKGMQGMQGMQGMSGMSGMSADMGGRHQMMEKRMEMMQTMMKMMMDRMPAAPSK